MQEQSQQRLKSLSITGLRRLKDFNISFEVDKQGRWQVEAYVEIGEDSICLMQEYLIK